MRELHEQRRSGRGHRGDRDEQLAAIACRDDRPLRVVEPVSRRDVEPSPRIQALAEKGQISLNPSKPGDSAEVVILAVKPQVMQAALKNLDFLAESKSLIVSVAAGTTVSSIAGIVGPETRVVRAMPNTPASIGKGISVAVGGKSVTASDKDLTNEILGSVGQVRWIEDEGLLDVVTALSAAQLGAPLVPAAGRRSATTATRWTRTCASATARPPPAATASSAPLPAARLAPAVEQRSVMMGTH